MTKQLVKNIFISAGLMTLLSIETFAAGDQGGPRSSAFIGNDPEGSSSSLQDSDAAAKTAAEYLVKACAGDSDCMEKAIRAATPEDFQPN